MIIYGIYSSDDDEITHDGTILEKISLTYEDIKFNVSFDVSIELVSGTTYTGTVTIDLPTGNIIQTGTATYEINDMKDIIFKRN